MSQGRRQPQRTCLGCREARDQSELIRFVRSPEGQILVDLRGRLPGRGAYVCWSRGCVDAVVQRKQFERSFRSKCQPLAVEQVLGAIEDELLSQMQALLGMARKSAQFVAGSNAVLNTMGKVPLRVVLIATDISQGIGDKVKAKADKLGIETICLFDKNNLGRILGRAERSVVSLPVGQLAEAFMVKLSRYQGISGEN